MRKLPRLLLALSLVTALGLSLIGQVAWAAPATAPLAAPMRAPSATKPTGRTATLSEVHNQVFRQTDANAPEQPAANGQTLNEGGSVRTGAKSSVRLDLSEGTLIRIKEQSSFTLSQLNHDSTNPFTQLSLAFGKLWIILNGGTAQVETPTGIAAVRGSYMGVSYNPALNEIKVTCLETKFTCTVTLGGVIYQLRMGQQLSAPPVDNPRIEAIDCGEQREWLAYNPESAPFIDPSCIVHDQDGDGIPDQLDNCPQTFNSDQLDSDSNGVGNACQGPVPTEENHHFTFTATPSGGGGGGGGGGGNTA